MRRSARGLAWPLVLVVALLGGSTAEAQAVPTGEYSALRFTPAPGPGNYFMVEGGRVSGHLSGSAGMMLEYGYHPLRLYPATCDAMGSCSTPGGVAVANVVGDLGVAHVYGSLALFDRVQISLVVPLAIGFGELVVRPGPPPQPTLLNGGTAFAVADPRLHVKVNLVDDTGSGFRLAAVLYGTAPVGHLMAAHHYLGEVTPTFGGHLVGELVLSGFHVAVNLGGIWRDGQQLFAAPAQSQMTYALALGYEITPLIDIFAEVTGGTSFNSHVEDNGIAGLAGGRIRVDDVVFSLGAGLGFVRGIGDPAFRAVGGFLWAPLSGDADHDGIADGQDACPSEAEDVDGYDDTDGCPDEDNDGDGIHDAEDACPNEPEDVDGQQDTDGCPDLDTDGDGIADGYDSCPTAPEDIDGDRDDDGCPDDDRDRDHIPDAQDQCPDTPEDTDGYGDEDGCPETDFDGDGIPDESDQCPDQPEDMDGFEDDDGCPEEGHRAGRPGDRDADTIPDAHDHCPDQPEDHDGYQDSDGCPDPDNDGDGVPDAQDECPTESGTAADSGCPHLADLDLAHGMITIAAHVDFAPNRHTILETSTPLLQQVLDLLVVHPEIASVRIEGHTDTSGAAAHAMELSGHRAAAVRRWLVDHFVDESRLVAFGCGRLHPVGDNATEAGRAANQRIVFQILVPAASGMQVFGDCAAQP